MAPFLLASLLHGNKAQSKEWTQAGRSGRASGLTFSWRLQLLSFFLFKKNKKQRNNTSRSRAWTSVTRLDHRPPHTKTHTQKALFKQTKIHMFRQKVRKQFWYFIALERPCIKKVECANSQCVKWESVTAGVDSLDGFRVFGEEVGQVSHCQHGRLRLLHSCAGVAALFFFKFLTKKEEVTHSYNLNNFFSL